MRPRRKENNNGITAECVCPRKSGCVGAVHLVRRPINRISTPASVILRDRPEQSPMKVHVPAQVEDPLASTAARTRAKRAPAGAS